jgi:hypothetical protein
MENKMVNKTVYSVKVPARTDYQCQQHLRGGEENTTHSIHSILSAAPYEPYEPILP